MWWKKIKKLEKRVSVLERQAKCPHNNVEFVWGWIINGRLGYIKRCRDCGAVLKVYKTNQERLEDKLAYVKERSKQGIEEVKQALNDVIKQS